MDLTELQSKLTGLVSGFPQISLVYLFGSQVSGNVGPMSDYDFAILCDAEVEETLIQLEFTSALIHSLNTTRIDVVALNHAPIELAYHVIAQGKLLYQRSIAIKVEYEATVLTRYMDYLPVLRLFRQQLIQGDSHGKPTQRYRKAFERTERTLEALNAALRKKPD